MNKIQTEKINNKKSVLIALILILIIVIGGGILAYLWNKEEAVVIPPVSPTPTPAMSSTPTPTPTPILVPPKEIWETYTSSQFGFSIKYPQMVYGVYRCSPNKPFYVPLKVFEDKENGITYLTEEYYYDDWDSEAQSNTGPCQKIIRSLETLKNERKTMIDINDKLRVNSNPFLTWVIVVQNINNADLNKFIKNNYGSGCLVGNKKTWKQKGVYEIEIKGEDWDKGADLGTTTCPWNYNYKILYAPEKNKIMSVNLGQECGFYTDPDSQSYKCYDEEMIDNFNFN